MHCVAVQAIARSKKNNNKKKIEKEKEEEEEYNDYECMHMHAHACINVVSQELSLWWHNQPIYLSIYLSIVFICPTYCTLGTCSSSK